MKINIVKKLNIFLACCFICYFAIGIFTYQADKVVIVVMDGARISETFNDPDRVNIPYLDELSKQGSLFRRFYNNGKTKTMEGYATILTGVYHEKVVEGDLIKEPSIFQVFIQQKKFFGPKAQAVLSKEKLKVFENTGYLQYPPQEIYAGKDGEDMTDDEAFNMALDVLENEKPSLLLVGFAEPDVTCHVESFEQCVEQIRVTDKRIVDLWKHIQAIPFYKNKTTLIVTNDHGRHLDGVKEGFSNHGDGCMGCRNVFLLAVGPDIKKGYESPQDREQIDIASTIAELLNFNFPSGKGRVLQEMFIEKK